MLAVKNLGGGESLRLGEDEGSLLAKPEGAGVADFPVRAVGTGWELDARGATGGELFLRGRKENPAELGRTGAPIPIVAGDYGLIQYKNFGVFFQFSNAAPIMGKRRRPDWALFLSFIFAVVAVGGGLALIWAITTPQGIPKPLELTSQQELELEFNMKPEDIPPDPQVGKEEDKGQGVKDPGAKDKKEQGGGKKIAGAEGKLGKQGKEKDTKLTGEPKNGLGGMSEALSSDVGDEVRKTLGTISSVADALGGLRSDQIVLGQGSGTGLKGGGPGGGGDGPGVPFGSGTLDTGWGPGRGGGFGSGSGGPGGRGLGGNGRGGLGGGEGSGSGNGEGGGEHKVTGKDAPPAGQGLSADQIRRVVMSRMGAFQACYEIATATNPTLKGSVGVSFSITPGGAVASASVGNSSLSNPRVEGCILRQFNRLHFPTADKASNASFPFVFRPSKK
ncbi:MAG TPA: AgmX/PglI C-terminal domain-containing protein [Polyangiaceae bacterium]